MAKKIRSNVDSYYFPYPAGPTIVTSHAQGRSNAMAVAWHVTFSNVPRRYGVLISPRSHTHSLIAESGEFVVNFMPVGDANLIAMVGGCSGRDIDKFTAFQIGTVPASEVSAPVLAGAYASYECRLVERRTYGDHSLFIADVVAVQWEESAFSDDGTIDLEQVSPVIYIGEDQYGTITQTAHHDRKTLVQAALKTQ